MNWDRRRWSLAALVALVVLDVVVLAVAYRARGGALPSWQAQETRFDVSAAAAEGSGSDAGEKGSTTVLLAVNPAGLVLKAVRGACQERFSTTAQLAVGRADDGHLRDVRVPAGLREALGVMVFADGTLRVTGLSASCAPVTFDSSDDGDSWQPTDLAGIWGLDGDVTAQSVTAPGGAVVGAPCVPQSIVNLPGRRAVGSCSATAFFELVPGATSPAPLSATGVQRLSVTAGAAAGHFYAFGATDSCGASVNDVDAANESTTGLKCLGPGRAPLAIASSGKWLVVQAGDDLLTSTDGGNHFS